jgi:hypothetical protein
MATRSGLPARVAMVTLGRTGKCGYQLTIAHKRSRMMLTDRLSLAIIAGVLLALLPGTPAEAPGWQTYSGISRLSGQINCPLC